MDRGISENPIQTPGDMKSRISIFDTYVGKNINGAKVITLFRILRAHNLEIEDDRYHVSIDGKTSEKDLLEYDNKIKTESTYVVKFEYSEDTAYIISANIIENR